MSAIQSAELSGPLKIFYVCYLLLILCIAHNIVRYVPCLRYLFAYLSIHYILPDCDLRKNRDFACIDHHRVSEFEPMSNEEQQMVTTYFLNKCVW